jgi:hypothetical protein
MENSIRVRHFFGFFCNFEKTVLKRNMQFGRLQSDFLQAWARKYSTVKRLTKSKILQRSVRTVSRALGKSPGPLDDAASETSRGLQRLLAPTPIKRPTFIFLHCLFINLVIIRWPAFQDPVLLDDSHDWTWILYALIHMASCIVRRSPKIYYGLRLLEYTTNNKTG